MRYQFILFGLWISVASAADEMVHEVWTKSDGRGATMSIIYNQAESCALDTYSVPESGLQERISQEFFASCSQARETAKSRGGKLRIDDDPLKPQAEPKFVTETNTVLWTATELWSTDWERRYSRWVEENVDASFHERHGIATDCADVAISLRWIFSRINSLPVGNTLAGGTTLFTNESMRRAWRDLPTHANWWQDRLFLAALNYVLDNTYTHSLLGDGYPVAVNQDAFAAGMFHLNIYSTRTGHTQQITEISPYEITVVASTVPRALRKLYEHGLDEEQFPDINRGGFLKIRWAEKVNGNWRLRPRRSHPDQSNEQYDPRLVDGYPNYIAALLGRLGFAFDPSAKLIANFRDLEGMYSARVQVVQDGFAFCQQNDCSPGSEGWETWGTPNRDRRYRKLVTDSFAIYENYVGRYPDLERVWRDHVEGRIKVIERRSVSYKDLLDLIRWDYLSYDPRHSVLRRWGLE